MSLPTRLPVVLGKVDYIPAPLIQPADPIGQTTATVNAKVVDGKDLEGRFRYRKLHPDALEFDGVDNHVEDGLLGSTFGSDVDKGTIEFWMKPTVDKSGYVLGTEKYTAPATMLLLCWHGPVTGYYKDRITLDMVGKDWLGVVLQSTPLPDDGTWKHIAMTFDTETSGHIYCDGIDVTHAAYLDEETYYDIPYDLMIGCLNEQGVNKLFFDGLLADVRIWSVVRTQQQIVDNMHLRLVGNETGLFAYWKFDEGDGTTAADSVGTRDGTIEKASWTKGHPAEEWVETPWANGLTTDSDFHADLTDLDEGTEYEFQAQLRGNGLESEWSDSEFFTTLEVIALLCSEKFQFSDSNLANLIINAVCSDTFKTGDSLESQASLQALLSDKTRFSDWSLANMIMQLTGADTLKLDDAATAEVAYFVSLVDSLKLSDTALISLLYQVVSADKLRLSDTPSTIGTFHITAEDKLRLTDFSTTADVFLLLLREHFKLQDTATANLVTGLLLEDKIRLADESLASLIYQVAVEDKLRLTDASRADMIMFLLLSDGLRFSDALSAMLQTYPELTEGLRLSDTPLIQAVFQLLAEDTLRFSDATSLLNVYNLIIEETFRFSDAATPIVFRAMRRLLGAIRNLPSDRELPAP